MSNYYTNQESVANIYSGLIDKGWNCFGYKADQSDSMTDYWSPARWEGIAEKNGFILLVDVYSTSMSGHKVTKQGYTPDYSKIRKLEATMNDSAATENEKAVCQSKIDSMMNKQEESREIILEYPTFSQGNPRGCNWHIEKDGNIIAKGKGAFQCDGYLYGHEEAQTMEKVNAFIDKIESKINGKDQLVPVQKKVVKKVTKPVENKINLSSFVKDETIIKLNSQFTGGHGKGTIMQLVEVKEYNGKTLYTFVKLGKKYQQLKRYGAANNTIMFDGKNIEKWLEEGTLLTMELKEVEEVSYKTVYKKSEREGQKDNLLQSDDHEAEVKEDQPKTETNVNEELSSDSIEVEMKLNEEKNGVELYFDGKPSEEVRNQLKANKFRWSKRQKMWYAPQNENTLSLARKLTGEGESTQQDETPLNDVEKIMSDIKHLEGISEAQINRIEILLNHWNNKNMAILKALYMRDNGNLVFHCEDIRKGISTKDKYSTIFKAGESGYSPNEKEFQAYEDTTLLYTVGESEITHNSELTEEQRKTLDERLSKDHVKPMRLYKAISNDSVLLECINLNIDQDKQDSFFFSISENGNEHGKGYNFEYLDQYKLIFTYNSEDKEEPANFTNDYPEIEIDDCRDDKYNIPQSVIDREHDANWIFRRGKRDYNQDLQETFIHYNTLVMESLEAIDNPYFQFKIKEALQRFKKKYHETYVKWLSSKGSQPSWAVSGRGNLNMSKYNKGVDRQNRIMSELVDLPKEFEGKINYYKNKDKKEKANQLKEKLKQELKQPLTDLKFKTVTKDFDLYGRGTPVKTRFYECEGYSIAKVWGAFRVFKNGKEVHSTKSNGTLKDAKAYVQLMIKKDREQSQAS